MPAQAAPTDVVRARLMEGLVEAVSAKGYVAVTISDIVRAAQVSKSTFYAQFADKEECFLAAYAATSEGVLDVLVEAGSREGLSDDERIVAATEAYLGVIAANPALSRTFIVEVLAAGPAALQARHRVNRRFADELRRLVDERQEGRGSLSAPAALILVGGMNELVLDAVVEDRVATLPGLADRVARLVSAAVDVG